MGAQADAEKAKSHSPEYDEKIVGFPKRYILALMIFLGFCVLYALRVNLNVAIGAMCNNHTIYVNGFYVKKVCDLKTRSLSMVKSCCVELSQQTESTFLGNKMCAKI